MKTSYAEFFHFAEQKLQPELDDFIISYLPYPHSFEQALTCNSIINGF